MECLLCGRSGIMGHFCGFRFLIGTTVYLGEQLSLALKVEMGMTELGNFLGKRDEKPQV